MWMLGHKPNDVALQQYGTGGFQNVSQRSMIGRGYVHFEVERLVQRRPRRSLCQYSQTRTEGLHKILLVGTLLKRIQATGTPCNQPWLCGLSSTLRLNEAAHQEALQLTFAEVEAR